MTTLLSIKVITRDRSKILAFTLRSILRDTLKSNISLTLVVVDDSVDPNNREQNRTLCRQIGRLSANPVMYIGREEYISTASIAPNHLRQELLAITGVLGDLNYRPSRARNIAQLARSSSKYELLIDDDVIVDPYDQFTQSIIGQLILEFRNTNSFVSVDLKGVPDLSLLSLLEFSLVAGDRNRMNIWSKGQTGFRLSGGFLLYPFKEKWPPFPAIYNEDFLWIAYCIKQKSLLSNRVVRDVFHSPDKPKHFELKRLLYEVEGELLMKLFEKSDLAELAKHHVVPTKEQVQKVVADYRNYVAHVMSLLVNSKQGTPSTDFLIAHDKERCETILVAFLKRLEWINSNTLLAFCERWINEIPRWHTVVETFHPLLLSRLRSRLT